MIAYANRDAARGLLDRIAATSPWQTELIKGLLYRLAPMVLCKRWHQGQTDEVVDKWLQATATIGTWAPATGHILLPSPSFNLRAASSTTTLLRDPPMRLVAPQRTLVLPPPRTIPTTPTLSTSTRTTATATTTSTPTAITVSTSTTTTTTTTTPTLATTTSIPRFDPYSTFDIHPDSRGFSCVGHSTREGGRCSRLISRGDRIAALALLDRIAARSLSKRKLESLLSKLAPVVLCNRGHHRQAERVVAEWVRKVDEMAAVIRRTAEEESTRGRQRGVTPRHRRRARDESEDGSESSDDSGSGSSSDNDSDSDSGYSDDDTASQPELEPEEPTAAATASATPPPRAVRRQVVEGECPICFSDLQDPNTELVWCKAQCGQNLHKECFDTWASTSAGGSRVTCVYW
ncbi:hypothetical protein GP486_000420 [Trichoglossum hirsutum]|uniref:RING-type domain-containing protein n=1 Tax=Trichoglossum hirsutum TaxID=265104 RepID=A0A9P8RTK9_9PEZI|nr:hypothetical protein GP486_000420 [Trichoglossum hirsutum]